MDWRTFPSNQSFKIHSPLVHIGTKDFCVEIVIELSEFRLLHSKSSIDTINDPTWSNNWNSIGSNWVLGIKMHKTSSNYTWSHRVPGSRVPSGPPPFCEWNLANLCAWPATTPRNLQALVDKVQRQFKARMHCNCTIVIPYDSNDICPISILYGIKWYKMYKMKLKCYFCFLIPSSFYIFFSNLSDDWIAHRRTVPSKASKAHRGIGISMQEDLGKNTDNWHTLIKHTYSKHILI